MSKDRGTAFVSSTQNNGTGTRSMPHVRISASRASASFSAPVDTAAITPTFFDGTYFSSAPDGSSTHNDNMGTHYLTGYSIPKWRYIYNTTLVALDLLTIIAASGIVFLFRPSAYAYVRGIGPGEYGIFSFLRWLAPLGSSVYMLHALTNGIPWVRLRPVCQATQRSVH